MYLIERVLYLVKGDPLSEKVDNVLIQAAAGIESSFREFSMEPLRHSDKQSSAIIPV